MQARLADAQRTGQTVIDSYDIDDVHVTLLVPFGRQDGLSLGMIATGIRTTEVRDSSGTVISSNTAPFETMWAMRRATGARWLTIAELPVPDNA
jgi:predicted lipid-binding transport protein (Tim44 family)